MLNLICYLPNDWKRFNDELYKFDQGWDDEYETWKKKMVY